MKQLLQRTLCDREGFLDMHISYSFKASDTYVCYLKLGKSAQAKGALPSIFVCSYLQARIALQAPVCRIKLLCAFPR
jgi:hypothetical protein